MGAAESTPAGAAGSPAAVGTAGGAANAATKAFFALVNDAARREALSRLSTRVDSWLSTGAPTTSPFAAPASFDASWQPLLRALVATDPGLPAAQAAHVGPGRRFATPDDFWRACLAAVAALQVDAATPATVTAPARASPATTTATSTTAAAAAPSPDDEEVALLTLPETFAYRVPPRPSAAGYRAADWGLDKPLLTGMLRVTATNAEITVMLWHKPPAAGSTASSAPPTVALAPLASGFKLVVACRIPLSSDKGSTAGGATSASAFARPLEHYLEPVVDSSRYFVMRGAAPGGGGSGSGGAEMLVGIGFRGRQAAFDLRAAIMDHGAFVARQRGGALFAAGDAGLVGTIDDGRISPLGDPGAAASTGDAGGLAGLAAMGVEQAEFLDPADVASTAARAVAAVAAANVTLGPLAAGSLIAVPAGRGASGRSSGAGVGPAARSGGAVPLLRPPPAAAAPAPAPAAAAAAPAAAESAAKLDAEGDVDDEWGAFEGAPAAAVAADDPIN